jgi:hypothetical protein
VAHFGHESKLPSADGTTFVRANNRLGAVRVVCAVVKKLNAATVAGLTAW